MKQKLTLEMLVKEAQDFAEKQSRINHLDLLGTTDGKAVGTYMEHIFKNHLSTHYNVNIGNSAKGIDLPDDPINTDIKVTSYRQPQSSCPFKSAGQKIFGLGYHLLVFVYQKEDKDEYCKINFLNCTFIPKEKTADYTITRRLREMIADGANKEDILSYLNDRCIPGDDLTHNTLAEKLLNNFPEQGYLTISNALQWRLQYQRVISLENEVKGIINYDRTEK